MENTGNQRLCVYLKTNVVLYTQVCHKHYTTKKNKKKNTCVSLSCFLVKYLNILKTRYVYLGSKIVFD